MQKISAQHAHQRPVQPSDHGLIYNSLLKSYQYEGYGAQGVDKDLFFNNHKKQIERILDTCYGICAVDPDDHDLIYAYILFYPPRKLIGPQPVLHYVYVKTSFRNMGFATWLIEAMCSVSKCEPTDKVTTTHRTKSFQRFIEKAKGQFVFNPYLLGDLHGSSPSKECQTS